MRIWTKWGISRWRCDSWLCHGNFDGEYGAEEFTTKQLEKDFRNAAYATIRTFVMKFHEMGLVTARKAGNRVFYRVGGTSDGRPNESKRRTL